MAEEVRKNEEEIERLRLAEQEVLEQTDEWKAKVSLIRNFGVFLRKVHKTKFSKNVFQVARYTQEFNKTHH